MKKFFIDVLCIVLALCFCVGITIFVFYRFVPNQYETNYISAMNDKYTRLQSVESPKVVLIGDSNLAFGIDTELLQNSICMPVVNMGLHGGLGNEIQTRLSMSNICQGDIYVLCYTDYGQVQDLSQKDLTLIMLADHKELWGQLSYFQILKLIPALPDYIFNSLSYYFSGRGNQVISADKADYALASFDKYGDNKIRVEENRRKDLDKCESRVGIISDETINMINMCKKRCEEHGAYLVIAGYPIIRTDNMDTVSMFEEYGHRLEESTGVINISDFSDYIMPSELFYDSIFHLTIEGAEHRTRILAGDINRFISNKDY